MNSIPRLAYIAQLDLPGRPIKIGCSKNPVTRLQAFDCATPVACRMIGITINGIEREKEMLAATEKTKIKGEWRYETRQLQALVNGWFEAGEWFTPNPNGPDMADVTRRVIAACPWAKGYIGKRDNALTPVQLGYFWAGDALKQMRDIDPLIGVHWAGYERATERPSFAWHDSPLSIARAA